MPELHGAYPAIASCSHRDLEKVREIRRELERRGCNLLCFFLKCLDADNALLSKLIRDEIKACNWFCLIPCISRATKRSKWVREGIQLVKALSIKPRKNVAGIHLDKKLKPEWKKLERLAKRATVFISHARRDQQIAKLIQDALHQHDFDVWFDEEAAVEQSWADANHSAIDEAAMRGFVLVLLSPHSLASQGCKRGTEFVLQRTRRAGGKG